MKTFPSRMTPTLSILLLEDDAADAELIRHTLNASGFSFRLDMICTEAELREHMEKKVPDLILSDNGLPSFSGFKALKIVRATHPDLPFIFVSGSNDQGIVTKMYDEGATDYVYKRDIKDLKSAVLRALEPETAREPELKLQIPPTSKTQPVFSRGIIHLLFCPQCRRMYNDAGGIVRVEASCETHAEVVIYRQRCLECEAPRKAG